MRTNRIVSNEAYKKRVDHDGGRRRTARATGSAVCTMCGLKYSKKHWMQNGTDADARRVVCPACKQKLNREPHGFVYLDGGFLIDHEDEVEHLLRNEARRAKLDNPLAQFLTWQRGGDHRLSISTTTEQMAQRVGYALQQAFGGEVVYDFSHENKLARVSWRRD